MENFLTIKERILSFLDAMKIKKVDFFESTGIQSSNFKGKNMMSQPGGDMIVKVLTLYPSLSAEWLMRGEGDMLRHDATNGSDEAHFVAEPTNSYAKRSEQTNIDTSLFISTLKEQAEEIGRLKECIRQLTVEKEKHVSSADIDSTANVG